MNFIYSKQADGSEVKLFYQDIGQGIPVVFIHGWPLSSQMWEYQLAELPDYGLRCITYDRRGFGKSDQPFTGYDYDTLADDLKAVLDYLNLNNVTLVAFSMGGGELVRYFSRHGGERVSKAVLVSSVAPYMLQTEDNPEGVPQEQVDEIVENIYKDRPGFLAAFGKQFFGVSMLSHPVSQGILDWSLALALPASLKATVECVYSFAGTDFRSEMQTIKVPTMIIHGDADQTVPISATGERASTMIPQVEYYVYEGEPHGLYYTAKDQLNKDLIEFITGVVMYDADVEDEGSDELEPNAY
jgi:pimeloyl-ACP methyl ester carboxylesterase